MTKSGTLRIIKNSKGEGSITTISSFWYRRVCEMALVMALLVLAAYGLKFLAIDLNGDFSFSLPHYVAGLAGVTALVSFIGILYIPKKYLYHIALIIYLILVITLGALVAASGVISSPFVSLVIIAIMFAGLFGWNGLALVGVAINAYLVFDIFILQEHLTGPIHIATFVLLYDIPLVISWVAWHSKRPRESDKDKAYSALARELSQVANKAEIVINAIADGVIAVDGKGVIQLINPAAQKIIGWGKQDAVGLDFKSVLKLEDEKGEEPSQKRHPVKYTLHTNETKLDDDLSLITSSGKKRIISLMTSPLGQPGSGAILVFRDITQAKKEEREQAEFISTASHEMRTPVASIEGYLGLAMNPQTANIDDKARLYLAKAQESAQHLGKLFQDLLDISRIEDGRMKSTPSVIDVVALSKNIVSDFEPAAQKKRVILLFKPDQGTSGDRRISPVFYTYADNSHLREVISNLIDNAIKYTQEGDVTVDVAGDNENVTIKVTDTGIGIPAEDIPHLFQKFYRVDNTDTREIGGTGLGLYLSRRLVEHMQGRIWVESEYHKGSTFSVELPRMAHDEATQKLEESAEAAAQKPPRKITQSVPPVASQPLPQLPVPPPAAPQPAPQTFPPPTAPIQSQNPPPKPALNVPQQQPSPPPAPQAPPQQRQITIPPRR